MKTRLLLLAALALLSGCSSLPQRMEEFSKLGLKEVEISGKFSHTKYRVTETQGKKVETLEHSNAWVSKVRIVRETQPIAPNE